MIISASRMALIPVLKADESGLEGFGVFGYKTESVRSQVSFFVSGIRLINFSYKRQFALRIKWLPQGFEIREEKSDNPGDVTSRDRQAIVISLLDGAVVTIIGDNATVLLNESKKFQSQFIEINFSQLDFIEILPMMTNLTFGCTLSQKRHRIEILLT